MAGSSPPRPGRYSNQWASPGQRSTASDFLFEDRNSEATHKTILERARREHERVRRKAEEVYQQYLLEEEQRRVEEQRRQEEERIRAEEQLAAERRRLAELKAKKVEIPPVPAPEPPQTAPPQPKPDWPTNRTPTDAAPKPNLFTNAAGSTTPSQLNGTSTPKAEPPATTTTQPAANSPFAQPNATNTAALSTAPTKTNIFAPAAKTNVFAPSATEPSPSAASAQAPKLNVVAAPKPSPVATGISSPATPQGPAQANGQSQPAQAPTPREPPPPDRYQIIHKNLKDLRRSMVEQAKSNPALKNRMGDMRREVRKCVGQLVHGGALGQNKPQVRDIYINPTTTQHVPTNQFHQIITIKKLLKEALENGVQSAAVPPDSLVLAPREPVEGATHNEAQISSLFLYLLNIFSKAVISQFINEASAQPETADPVGVVVASVFAASEFLWRGQSLIDILLAKFRVVCPVVFGHNGNDKYEEGRRRVGWRQEGGAWVLEAVHTDRMAGLGAGFAAIALRKFPVKSAMTNPFPRCNYWTAMARIINTPPAEISNTQAVVLRAMIQFNEQKFVEAYGSAGVAALRLALVDFPAKAPTKSTAINALEVHAQYLEKTTGLKLV
jgi:nucleoporin GLE1